MSQFDFGTIDPDVMTGTQLAINLNAWRDALHSGHLGVGRPAYVKPGMLWVEQVNAATWNLKLNLAPTLDVTIAQFNPGTGAIMATGPYLPTAARAAANGVASLDAATKVPVAQVPDLSGTYLTNANANATFIPLAQKAAANGVATLDANLHVPSAQLVFENSANCRFNVNTATECRLFPYGGNTITINNVNYIVPDAGAVLANGMVALDNTLYYVYAYAIGQVVALEASTVGYQLTVGGMVTKSGDATRTLVGMVYKGSNQFISNPQNQLVRSYYNDPGVVLGVSNTNVPTVTAAPFVEPDPATRCSALTWTGETVAGTLTISAYTSTGPSPAIYVGIGMDSLNVTAAMTGVNALGPGSYGQAHAVVKWIQPNEGYHDFRLLSGVTGGSFTWLAGYCGIALQTMRGQRN